jgi:membrane protein DedA with SNARE-associated domain
MATLLPYFEHFTYVAAFVLLLAAGVGVPIPEDIPILLSGYLSHRGVMRLEIALPVCFAGVLLGDTCLFLLARRGASALRRSRRLAGFVTTDRVARAHALVARYGVGAIVTARHIAGLRVAVFAAAGAAGMRFRRFILWDAFSALASVPLMLMLGFLFADRLEALLHHLHRLEHWAFAIALLVAIVAVVHWQWSDRLPAWWPGSTDRDTAID